MVSIENLKITNYHTFSKKTLILPINCSKYKSEGEKIIEEEESIEILTILCLI